MDAKLGELLLSIIAEFRVIDFREVFGLGEVFSFGRF